MKENNDEKSCVVFRKKTQSLPNRNLECNSIDNRKLSVLSLQDMTLEQLRHIDSDHADVIFTLLNNKSVKNKKVENKQRSDQTERKAFDIIKKVPIIGLAYRIGRAIVYKIKDEQEEITYSLTLDVANLNPIRIVTGIPRAIMNATHNYDDGVWIGKRSLKKCTIGITLSPNVDLWHYAIMIRGIVYHVQGSIELVFIDVDNDSNLKKSFEWTFITHDIIKTDSEIKKYIENFDYFDYSIVPNKVDDLNCQTFTKNLLSFVTDWDDDYIKSKLRIIMGTIYF